MDPFFYKIFLNYFFIFPFFLLDKYSSNPFICYMIREKIIETLTKKNISRYRLCKALDIDQSHFHHFLNGASNMSTDNIEKILKFLNLKISAIDKWLT